jgi:hypothetical protein
MGAAAKLGLLEVAQMYLASLVLEPLAAHIE